MKEIDEQTKIEIDEIIDKFLRGQMSEEEEATFKKEIASDYYMRHRAKERLLLIRGVKQFGQEQDQAVITSAKQATREQVEGMIQKPKVISLTRMVLRPMAIAAVVAAVCFIPVNNFLLNQSSMDYADSSSTEVMSSFESGMRGSNETAKELDLLFQQAQQGKDIDKTIASLSEKYKITRDEYVDDEDDYAYQIGWFLTIAYLKDGQKDKAKETLQQLIKDYPEATEAQELLKKLNKKVIF